MGARQVIPYRNGEPEPEPVATGKLHEEELPGIERECVCAV